MGEYYIPLTTLVPILSDLPIAAAIPGWKDAVRGIGVRDLRERWNDGYAVVHGTAVVDVDTSWSFYGLELLFGTGDAGVQTELEFEYASDRASILRSVVELIFEEEGVPDSVDLDDEGQARLIVADEYDAADSALLGASAPTRAFRLTVRGLAARLRLPTRHFRLGQHVRVADEIVAIEPAAGDAPVDIALPSFTLVMDSVEGVELRFDTDRALDCPPFLIRDVGLGFEVDELKVDISRTAGFPEVINRPGFDETWCGVHIAAARVFNLHTLLPFLPSKIEVTNFLIDGEGTSGAFEAAWLPEDDPSSLDLWRLASFAIEWERGQLIRGTASVVLKVSGIGNEWAGIGPEGDLEVSATLRSNPDIEHANGWDFAIRAPGTTDRGLLYLGHDTLTAVTGGVAAALMVAAAVEDSADAGWAATGLMAAVVLEAGGNLTLERLILDGLQLRLYHREVAGHVVDFWDVVLDVQLSVGLDLDLSRILLPRFKTETPIGVSVRGLVLTIPVDPPDELDLPKVEFHLDHESGVSFDVGEETIIDLGTLVRVTKAALGRWDEGLWIELGLEVMEPGLDVGFSVSSIRFWLDGEGELVRVTPGDIGFSVFVPGAVYAKGSIELGDVTMARARGFLVQASVPTTPEAFFRRETYVWDVGVGLRYEDLDGVSSVVVSADLEWSTGVPVAFCPAVSWYGINALVAINAEPDVASGGEELASWFLDRSPKNQIDVSKFRGSEDAWGIGVGTVFGSSAGGGRFCSVKAGIMLQFPGPVLMITGTGNVLAARPSMGDTSSGAFAAILVIDCSDDGYISLDIRVDYRIPDSGSLVTITIPAEFLAGWGGQGFHLYLGRDKPASKRVRVRVIEIFDLSGYLMLDCADIVNLAETGVTVPGFAIALGGRAEWEWGIKARFLKIYFYLRAELNLALGVPDPVLFFAGVLLEGGLVFKVFGFGFEFGVHVDANFLARNPWRLWGTFQITVGLPWPLPDIEVDVPFSLGDDEVPLPEPPAAVAGLTLMDRTSNEPLRIEAGQALSEPVPLDPVLALTFQFPIRNAQATVGTFRLDGAENQTWWVASGDDSQGVKGYRFTLTDLRLQRREAGGWVDVGVEAPGQWTPREHLRAKGGRGALRDEITLLDWHGPLSSRLMGTSAGYWDQQLDQWDPCPDVPEPEPVCVTFDASAPGPFPPQRTLEGRPDLHIVADATTVARNAALTLRVLGATQIDGEVLPAPPLLTSLPNASQALALPMAVGSSRVAGPVAAMWQRSDELTLLPGAELRFPRARQVVIDLLVPARAAMRVRFLLGEEVRSVNPEPAAIGSGRRDGLSHSTGVGPVAEWRHVRLAADGPIDRAIIEVFGLEDDKRPAQRVYVFRACVVPEADAIAWEEGRRTRKAWSDFWADLVSQEAATTDALLLEPGARHRLKVDLEWAAIEDDPSNEVATGNQSAEFEFTTTTEAPNVLRPRNRSVGGGEDDWDVDTVPADGSFAIYAARPLGMLYRDPRVEAVFGKLGRRLVLRLVDEDGVDLFERIDILEANVEAMPEYQQRFVDFVTDQGCTPQGVRNLFRAGVADFPSVLARETWYDASIVSVPDPTGTLDLSALPADWTWTEHPHLHRFRFRTSRFLTFTEHVAAYVVLDEVADEAPDFVDVATAAGTTSRLVVDDQTLDAVVAALRLPPREPPWRAPPTPSTPPGPPRPPELVRVWRQTASGTHEVVALFMDGPEPLGVDGVDIDLAGSDSVVQVRGTSGARSVLLRRANGALSTWPTGAATLRLTDRFRDVEGTESTETLDLTVAIPNQPDSMNAEED